ncbi:MAG TPA: Gx transporter family protein [Oscillospiraceae bacterium]|uniref:Gx transporter family protein n=1 Tax=Pseudoruminococcus massiliensis TaxID=2086583 RepID=UPI003990FC83|nr:Gx transporter family protein [Oscillospiraceae bacterium]
MRKNNSLNIRKIAILSMFVTISLTIFVLESLMPPVINIPGIKPGFANIVTLFLLVNTNKRSAFTVLIVRIILASIFAGQIMSLFYSLSGGILSLLAMSIVLYITKKKTVWFASVVGAIFHNIGQILAAVVVLGSWTVICYLPVLLISGCITGLITGLITEFLDRSLAKGAFLDRLNKILCVKKVS